MKVMRRVVLAQSVCGARFKNCTKSEEAKELLGQLSNGGGFFAYPMSFVVCLNMNHPRLSISRYLPRASTSRKPFSIFFYCTAHIIFFTTTIFTPLNILERKHWNKKEKKRKETFPMEKRTHFFFTKGSKSNSKKTCNKSKDKELIASHESWTYSNEELKTLVKK